MIIRTFLDSFKLLSHFIAPGVKNKSPTVSVITVFVPVLRIRDPVPF
jgi:hypothetical protein